MTAWFHKELFSTPAYVGGRPVRFIEIGDDEGVLETTNENLIQELRKLASRHVGGIIEISQEQYEAKKKLPVVVRQSSPPAGLLTPLDPSPGPTQIKRPTPAGLAVVAAATGSANKPAQEPASKPRTDVAANRPAARNPRKISIIKAPEK